MNNVVKLLFFIPLILVNTNTMAETATLLDSIVDLTADDELSKKEAFIYDEAGNATTWYQYTMSSGQWTTLYTYQLSNQFDAQERVSRRNESLNTGSGWVLMNRTDFTYDEQGRLSMESRWSLSAVGNTWSEIARHVYQYGADNVVEKIFYQFGGGDDYLTYVLNAAESTPNQRVMDIYWTGYESEGTDGKRIYYFSEHEVQPAAIQTLNHQSPITNHKSIKDGVLLIHHNGQTFDARGARIE